MKFVQREMGAAAEVSSGGGGRGLLREILVLGGASLLLVAGLYFAVGLTVDRILPHISFQREQRWFSGLRMDSFPEAVEAGADAQRERVRATLDRLTASPDAPPLDFSLILLDDENPNAFAIPGGTVAVTTGLLQVLPDEIPLAFVLGHELGHFAHRDHLRGLGRRIGHSLVMAIVFGSTGANLASDQVTRLLDLGYSREQEEAADEFGFRLVRQTYGSVDGTDRLFLWLDRHRTLPTWAAVLTTHPDPADRIARLRELEKELSTAPEGVEK